MVIIYNLSIRSPNLGLTIFVNKSIFMYRHIDMIKRSVIIVMMIADLQNLPATQGVHSSTIFSLLVEFVVNVPFGQGLGFWVPEVSQFKSYLRRTRITLFINTIIVCK